MSESLPPDRFELLHRSWLQLFDRLAVEPKLAQPFFDDLVARYSEPHCHYHNLEHIADVLEVAGKLIGLAASPEAIFLAVWFHDAIYDTHAKDNEERSAQLAAEKLHSLGVAPDLIDKTANLILATAHTSESRDDIDSHILLDADLAILAAEEERYRRYAEAIRKEYAWVDEAAYRTGRSRVLQAFLNRPRIFHTREMFEAGEAAARRNIARELATLAGSSS